MNIYKNATSAWHHLLHKILSKGVECSPRGMQTKEVLHNSIAMDMNYPILHSPNRKLSFKFLAAEAYWILSGDNRVETIAPYNKNIAAFSDNGEIFAGAYGPSIQLQLPYIVNALRKDVDTRQAVLTIWKPNPAKSKDIPCTVTMAFNIRAGQLNCHVFMRSSDAWLGFPYDVFNFSMVAVKVASMINRTKRKADLTEIIQLGTLYWTAASSHLYEQHYDKAKHCLENDPIVRNELCIPKTFLMDHNPLMNELDKTRNGSNNCFPKKLWK